MCKCKFVAICKFFEPISVKEQKQLVKIEIPAPKKRGGYKKRKLGKAGKKITNLSTSKEDIKHVRGLLKQERKRGRLDENQVAALDFIGKTNYENLTEGQKEQLLDIYNGSRRAEKVEREEKD